MFINYRGEDSPHCAALIDHTLSVRLGVDRVFRDCRSIPAGEDFADAILDNLIHCSVLLVVIGPRWLTLTDDSKRRRIDSPDDWIHREIAEAFAHGLRVVPILTDDVDIPAEANLPTEIARLSRCQYLRVRHRHDRYDLARLVETLLDIDPGLARGRSGAHLATRILTIGCLVAAGLFTGSLASVPNTAPPSAIGEDLPPEDEFLAMVINQATGKCIARNGPYSHPTESERVGREEIYQWDCLNSDNPGHTVVLAPASDGWLIRSSIRIDLCLAADGAPGQYQHFQLCEQADERQRWRIRRISRGPVAETFVFQNHNTGMCLAHPGGDPATEIRIFQRACTPSPEGTVEWAIKRHPPSGNTDCRDYADIQLRNHETDQNFDADSTLSLTAVRRSAHGCTTFVIEPGWRCLSATPEVQWLPCIRQPDREWILEPMGSESGRQWYRLHLSHTMSKCLQPKDLQPAAPLVVDLCDDNWLQQWHIE